MEAQAKRITFVITILDYGGGQTELLRLAMRLKKHLGWEVQVVSMLPPVAFTEELTAAGISVVSLEMNKGIADPRAILRLAKLLRQWQPLILHSHLVHANLLARVTRIFAPIPVQISTAQSINEGGRLREIAYRLTDTWCDLTTNVSEAATERYIEVGATPKNKITYIPNSIDTNTFCPNPKARENLRQELKLGNNFVWLAVGRLEEQKDYPNLLQAFAQVVGQCPDGLLLICGRGILEDNLVKLTQELGLKNKVKFLRIRHDIPNLMNAVDAYVMSSAWEGMPIVLLEASAVGLPIVATDVSGNAEVVVDNQSGFIVPPHNSNALAEAMLNLMQVSPVDREKMGKIGRDHVLAKYDIEKVVNRWENLYRSLLAKKGIIIK
jgi:glycosyltransferase involved in cell wall biosynthesis